MKQSNLKYWLTKSLRSFGYFLEPGFIDGYPEGLTVETLQQLVAERRMGTIRRIRHRHLSGWKHSGAFQLLVTGRYGRSFSCIFKNAIYSEGHIAALDGLSISPGPPEYLIYRHAGTRLQRYLPHIYMSREIKPGEHYQYLMEDLSLNYPYGDDREHRLLLVCERLVQIHSDLSDALDDDTRSKLLQYDQTFSERLLSYAGDNLRRLHARSKTAKLQQAISEWDRIVEVYLTAMSEVYVQSAKIPIHGDSNITNVLFHRTHLRDVKLIDWEWAGLGIPHCDLVSLLKGASPDVEQKGLSSYSKASAVRTLVQDRYIYEWCKLQRGLFDAAFFAKQILDSDVPPTRPLEGHVDRSLERAYGSHEVLRGMIFR